MSRLNAQEVLGRKVGIPGVAVGTIIAAGWGHKVKATRLDGDGTQYQTLVMGYLVRWETNEVTLMPLDMLKRSDLLPLALEQLAYGGAA